MNSCSPYGKCGHLRENSKRICLQETMKDCGIFTFGKIGSSYCSTRMAFCISCEWALTPISDYKP